MSETNRRVTQDAADAFMHDSGGLVEIVFMRATDKVLHAELVIGAAGGDARCSAILNSLNSFLTEFSRGDKPNCRLCDAKIDTDFPPGVILLMPYREDIENTTCGFIVAAMCDHDCTRSDEEIIGQIVSEGGGGVRSLGKITTSPTGRA